MDYYQSTGASGPMATAGASSPTTVSGGGGASAQVSGGEDATAQFTDSDPSSSQSTDAPLPSGTQDEPSGEPTGTTSAPPVDPPDNGLVPIRLDATVATRRAETGYSVMLTFNHQSLRSQGMAPDGSDLAIVHEQDGTLVPIHRVLDRGSAWDQAATRVWFALQAPLELGSVDQSSYFIQLRASPSMVLGNANEVFPFHHEFEALAEDVPDWQPQPRQQATSGSGDYSTHQFAGYRQIRSTAGAFFGFTHEASLISQPSWQFKGIRVEGQFRVPSSHNRLCNESWPLVLESSDQRAQLGLGVEHHTPHRIHYNSDRNREDWSDLPGASSLSSNWHHLALNWDEDRAQVLVDGATISDELMVGAVRQADQSPLSLRIGVKSTGPFCSVQSDRTELDMDWVLVRRYMRHEPVATLDPGV